MRGSPRITQTPDLQLTALKQAGCKRIFTDKATGAHVEHSELVKCLKILNKGGTLTAWRLGRLGRSLHDLISFLNDPKARGVGRGLRAVQCLQESGKSHVEQHPMRNILQTKCEILHNI